MQAAHGQRAQQQRTEQTQSPPNQQSKSQQQAQQQQQHISLHEAMLLAQQAQALQIDPALQQLLSEPLRLSNPTSYHMQQSLAAAASKQTGPSGSNTLTIDPTLLGLGQLGGPHIKQELDNLDPSDFSIPPDFDINGAMLSTTGLNDSAGLMSPLSSSPLDPPDFDGIEDFTPRGSSSLNSSPPYGTSLELKPTFGGSSSGPGVRPLAGNFYSMSMPVQGTSGFNLEQIKMLGAQASSFAGFGGTGLNVAEAIDETEQKSSLEVINEKRRRRRESHNAVERRRRDNINEKIQELSTLLPEFQSSDPSQTKPNKGVILRKSVDTLRHLQALAAKQQERIQELEGVLQRILMETGVGEANLGLSVPLGTPMESLVPTSVNGNGGKGGGGDVDMVE
ncbi:hypothetical protein HK102_008014 [Quaeritorhiza haematococci]|nr:hypothetical protein HK102_008014 [Quaeritorhiza haematococci]